MRTQLYALKSHSVAVVGAGETQQKPKHRRIMFPVYIFGIEAMKHNNKNRVKGNKKSSVYVNFNVALLYFCVAQLPHLAGFMNSN